MWKWGGKPQSKCYMVRLGNPIFQGDPLFFIFLYFSLFMTIFFHLFHGWLSQPVHSAVQCVFCCSVAPFPRHWVRDGQRNGEEKEYLNKLQTSCREEITFLMQSFSSTGAVKSAMPFFLYFACFHSLNVIRMQKIQSSHSWSSHSWTTRTLLWFYEILLCSRSQKWQTRRNGPTSTLSDLWGTDKSDLICISIWSQQLNLVLKVFNVKCQYETKSQSWHLHRFPLNQMLASLIGICSH